MRKEVQKIIYYVILLGMTLCLSACTENAGATGKTEEASTENTEVTEQAQKYLETGDDDVRFVQADTERFGNRILFS